MPLDLRKTSCRMEMLQNITKTTGADKCKKIAKNGVEMQPKSMKNGTRNAIKNDAQKHSPKHATILKNDSHSGLTK